MGRPVWPTLAAPISSERLGQQAWPMASPLRDIQASYSLLDICNFDLPFLLPFTSYDFFFYVVHLFLRKMSQGHPKRST